MLKKLKVTDITSIEIDTTDDAITIHASISDGDGEEFLFEETLTDSHDNQAAMPSYLRKAARLFVEAAATAVRERAARKGPVPCSTCRGACCYVYDAVHITPADLSVLRKHGVPSKGYELFKEISISGHTGVLTKKPRTIGGERIETACFFLRKDGCSIYESRPTVCREYSAWTCGDTYDADPDKQKGRVRLRVIS